ncbi:glycine zipper 2TM domain-containing protein [Methylophilus aquaticus]|uniref:Glycine zipper 2TM domain-containing protein n=1 Tax=Methylophilus aquaticus TaxID=1971610 RepID=A0ABT9JU07_9PROT|nr:glycine zipper 2TM domain-containing protein [Methylophilus aquaticus]MDP8567595.1 glycine zipper 2TM domain-containing protein [Methylophilus aquaticus]
MRKLIGLSVVLMVTSHAALADTEFVDRARVISVAPQVQRINQPRQECHTEYVRESVYEPASRSNTGAVVGGVAGGLLGSTIGRGSGRVAAAAVGAGLGAIVGDRVGNQDTYGSERTVTRPIEQCVTIDQWQTVTTGYLVNYEYQGRQYSTLMDREPGPSIDVSVLVRPHQTQMQPPIKPAAWHGPAGHQYRNERNYW